MKPPLIAGAKCGHCGNGMRVLNHDGVALMECRSRACPQKFTPFVAEPIPGLTALAALEKVVGC